MLDHLHLILLLNGLGMIALLVTAYKVLEALNRVLVVVNEAKQLLRTANDHLAPLVRAANALKTRTNRELDVPPGAHSESLALPSRKPDVSDLMGAINVGRGIVEIVKKKKRRQ